MAELAAVCHWQPSELWALAPDELVRWYKDVGDALKRMTKHGNHR